LRHTTAAEHHPGVTITECVLILVVAALLLAPVAAPMLGPAQERERIARDMVNVMPFAVGRSSLICQETCSVS
jgi:hypothetical protein